MILYSRDAMASKPQFWFEILMLKMLTHQKEENINIRDANASKRRNLNSRETDWSVLLKFKVLMHPYV